jgi:hypothetical protein
MALPLFITVVLRPSLTTAPMHGFDASTAGVGKTKLEGPR